MHPHFLNSAPLERYAYLPKQDCLKPSEMNSTPNLGYNRLLSGVLSSSSSGVALSRSFAAHAVIAEGGRHAQTGLSMETAAARGFRSF